MASHDCPDGYTPIRHNNTSKFLSHNIPDPNTGAYWISKDTARDLCDNLDLCDGLLKSGSQYLMRRQLKTDTTYNHDEEGEHEWCVRDSIIESNNEGSIKTVSKRVSALQQGVNSGSGVRSSVKCANPTDACKGDLVYDSDKKTCVPTTDICGTLTLDADTGRCVANKSVCDDSTMTFQDGKCVSTVVTADNEFVCDASNLTFDKASGKCVIDSSNICGRDTKYNVINEQCERDGGCAIM